MRLADLVKACGVFGEEIGFEIDSGADAFLLQIRALNRVGDDPEHGTRCVELGDRERNAIDGNRALRDAVALDFFRQRNFQSMILTAR